MIDPQNTVQKSFICLICAVGIHKSIQFWKQYLRTNGFMSSLLYEILWNVQKSLPYFMPIGNKFLPSFIGPKLWRPKIAQKLGEQLSWKRFVETTTCQRLVSVGNFQLILLSMQINFYCLLTNQTPALLVQHAPWMQVTVMLVQSLYFSRPPPPRAIIPNALPLVHLKIKMATIYAQYLDNLMEK